MITRRRFLTTLLAGGVALALPELLVPELVSTRKHFVGGWYDSPNLFSIGSIAEKHTIEFKMLVSGRVIRFEMARVEDPNEIWHQLIKEHEQRMLELSMEHFLI